MWCAGDDYIKVWLSGKWIAGDHSAFNYMSSEGKNVLHVCKKMHMSKVKMLEEIISNI